MQRGLTACAVVACACLALAGVWSTPAAAADTRAAKVVAAVRELQEQYSLRAVVFGVWIGGRELVSGAIGNAYPGVRANRRMHFRIGNTTESFTSTLLLQLVDEGKIRLDDPLSKWYPSLPRADEITVAMLAGSTSGYADYVKNDAFLDAYHAYVFGHWSPSELIQIGTSMPMLFSPGASWSFSDTNFVLLGEILRQVGGKPVAQQIRERILEPLGLRDTVMTTTAETPPPVLHGYTDERGVYEDATFWNPSWATYTGNMTSTLADMGRWARAVGTGVLLSPQSGARMFAPASVGLGPLTPDFYYALGSAVANGWRLGGAPGLMGYTGIVSYLPSQRISLVVFTTNGPDSPPGAHYAGAIFNRVGAILAPSAAPTYPVGASAVAQAAGS
jgi:D-alanyl-D-alanine carboxypeptidase